MMNEKITSSKNIRNQLEKLYQQKYTETNPPKPKVNKYKGLGLNWRDVVILLLAMFFVGLYQAQAHDEIYSSDNHKIQNIIEQNKLPKQQTVLL